MGKLCIAGTSSSCNVQLSVGRRQDFNEMSYVGSYLEHKCWDPKMVNYARVERN